MTTTREQALKRLDELEKNVQEWKEHIMGTVVANKEKKIAEQEAQLKEDAKNTKGLLSANKDLQDAFQRKEEERSQLAKRLEGFAAFEKALGQIRTGGGITADQAREIAREEAAKVAGSGPAAEGVEITETIPYTNLKVSKPWLTLDESTAEGQISVIALHDKLPEMFGFSAVVKALEQEYSAHPRRATIQKALDDLVGKYKTLERRVEGNQLVYSLRADAKSRVKESTTREAVEAKE